MALIRTLARNLLAAPFVAEGVAQLRNTEQVARESEEDLAPIVGAVDQINDTETLVRVMGATKVAGGVLLGLGKFTRLSSLALAASLVPTAAGDHAFWNARTPAERAKKQHAFLRDLGLLGGLLTSAVDLKGKPGVAYRAKLAKGSVERGADRTRREARYAARAAKRETKLALTQAQNAVT